MIIILFKIENIYHFRLLVYCQQRTNQTLAIILASSYLIQNIFGIAIMVLLPLNWNAYWWATAWPISRFPVFLMGVCAGVLCQRILNGDEDAKQSKQKAFF